jgi:hypothetical protein
MLRVVVSAKEEWTDFRAASGQLNHELLEKLLSILLFSATFCQLGCLREEQGGTMRLVEKRNKR